MNPSPKISQLPTPKEVGLYFQVSQPHVLVERSGVPYPTANGRRSRVIPNKHRRTLGRLTPACTSQPTLSCSAAPFQHSNAMPWDVLRGALARRPKRHRRGEQFPRLQQDTKRGCQRCVIGWGRFLPHVKPPMSVAEWASSPVLDLNLYRETL